MAKAVFYIKDKVQNVGYRLFIVEKILHSGLDGDAINTPDGRIKVLLEGEKEHILQFYEELKKEKPELAENPTSTRPEFDESLKVPAAMNSSQALLLSQFSKGVGFLAGMKQDLSSMDKKLDAGFGGVKQELAGINQKLDQLPERIAGRIENKLDRIENKLGELPVKIAEAIRT